MKISVIVPVYNEILTIDEILRKILAVDLEKEIIIVDDFSTDGTREYLLRFKEKLLPDPKNHIKLFFHDKNLGKSGALKTGINEVTGDIVIIQDADLEYNPAEYPALIKPITEGLADVVYGSRFLGYPRRVLFFWHMLGNKLLTLMSNLFTNLNLTDLETCYKVFKADIIKKIPISSKRFGFEAEITAKIAKLKCRIYETGITYSGRTYAEGKKIRLRDAVETFFVILKYWLIEDLQEPQMIWRRTLKIMESAGFYNNWLFSRIKPYLSGTVLEIGSGIGNITRCLRSEPEVTATDNSGIYLEELRAQFAGNGNIRIAELDIAAEDIGKYGLVPKNTVLFINVLEHIKDDILAMRNVNSLLEKGGICLLLVPAFPMLYCDLDRNLGHHKRYNAGDIELLAERAGLKIKGMKYLNLLGFFGWLVNGRILRRKNLPSRQVRLFELLRVFLKVEDKIKIPFGLSLLAVLEKE